MTMTSDWQSSVIGVKHRSLRLFETMKWSDCSFLVGPEANRKLFDAHKLILAMASPVFEMMFFGSLAEKEYPIAIPDVGPQAFRALLEYIYTGSIKVETFENAAELCYVAQKYMLPHAVDTCIRYLTFNLNPANACRCYELAKFFGKDNLKEISMQLIMDRTGQVIEDPGFVDIELTTLGDILDMDLLNIKSELQLFGAIESWANAKRALSAEFEDGAEDVRKALKKIRFLLMTPKEFSEGPGKSKLLGDNDKYVILTNICSANAEDCPMPEGFSTSRYDRTYNRSYLSFNY